MTRLLPFLAATALVLAFAVPAPAAGPVTVTTEAEFQQALDGGATTIRLPKDGTITLTTGLIYGGSDALTILGRGATLDADGLTADAFTCTGGADVTLQDVTLTGGDGRGLVIEVPADQEGTVCLKLKDVVVECFVLYGVHVDDQAGSDASVKVDFTNVTLQYNGVQADVGAAEDDQDPLRVDETGDGDIIAIFRGVVSIYNVYDGIELDETGDGDVRSTAVNCTFSYNGDSGSDDVEDGFDIDEAGDGSIHASFTNVTVEDNFDEGIDLDEEDAGSVYLECASVRSTGSVDEGIKVSEEDDGDIRATLSATTASGTGDDGVQLEEADDGDLVARFSGCTFENNADDGIDLEQAGAGAGAARVTGCTFDGNGGDDVAADGVDVSGNND